MQPVEVLNFPRGNIYQIVCQEGGQALRVNGNDPSAYEGARIVSCAPNPNDLGQLFMVEKVGLEEDEFEIVNCVSSLVFDEEGGEINLKFGKQRNDQLFSVKKVPLQGNWFWIKTDKKGTRALALEGILRHKNFDPNAPNQIFAISLVNNSQPLTDTCILVNNNSGKALDLPAATFKAGERLVQWEKNKRFNQRWRWIKAGNGYLLSSVLSGKCVDIAAESKESGAKVIEWDRTGASNQQWAVKPAGNGIWKIKSVHAPGMFLSVKNASVDDGDKIEISDQENPSMYWRIEGFVPN